METTDADDRGHRSEHRGVNDRDDALTHLGAEVVTKLAQIVSSTEAIEVSEPREVGRHIADIKAATRDLGESFDDIIELAHTPPTASELETAIFTLQPVLDDVAAAFEPLCASRGVELVLRVDPGLPAQFRGDPARLTQVLHHLLTAAIDTTMARIVDLDVAQLATARVQFTISDRQPRSDITPGPIKPDPGLGIARHLIGLMGGSLTHRADANGISTRFDVRFGPARRIADRTSGATALASSPTAHVLVVDDSDVNRLLATSQLARLGHTYVTADSGADALETLGTETFDIVLMDWHMPGVDGLEATRRYREQHDPEHRLPIVTMTASAMTGDRERCLEAGASDYLPKPVSINDLSAMIARWTRADGPAPEPTPDEEAAATTSTGSFDEAKVTSLIDDLNDVNVVRSIVRAFMDMIPQYRSAAKTALLTGDRMTIRRSAHTLRSTAVMLGFDELARACTDLEVAAATADDDLDAPLAEFARCCDRCDEPLLALAARLDLSDGLR